MLTEEQTKNLKSQLIRHIESSFPKEKKQFAISQIEAMDSEQLEEFLIKNNLIKKDKSGKLQQTEHCVFCSIVSGDIKSYKIAENSKAIAVLEINPLSRGHAIIIPKEHITSEKELPKQIHSLAKKVSSLIKSKLKPEEVNIENLNILGHEIINIIPFYGEVSVSERKPAAPEELVELQEILTKKPIIKMKKPIEKKKKIIEKFEEIFWLPKRIP